jgi:YVTN family beta-propeller protein
MKLTPIFYLIVMLIMGTCFQELAYAAPYAYIPNTGVYYTGEGGTNISVIDTATDTVTATINVGSMPTGVAVNSAGTKVYVTNQISRTVSVIDAATNTVTATINVGNDPYGVAVNQAGTKVYVTDYQTNSVYVLDTATNTVIATIKVGNGPSGVTVNPAGTKAYVTNRDSNTVSVIDTETNTVTATINVGLQPEKIAVNPAGTYVYVASVIYNSASGIVSVIDTETNTVTATINVGNYPSGVAVNPTGTKAYVTNLGSNTVSVIDTETNTVIATINVGSMPSGVAVNPAGTKAYVVNSNNNSSSVSVINTASNMVIATIKVGYRPIAVGQFIMMPLITPLNVVADPVAFTVGTPTNVTFNVTSEGAAVNGVTVILSGNATGAGMTNATGIAVISVNATKAGSIISTASSMGYTNGTTTLMATVPGVTLTTTPGPASSPASSMMVSPSPSPSPSPVLMDMQKSGYTVAAVVVGTVISFFGVLLSKFLNILLAGVKSITQRWSSVKEVKIFGIMANAFKKPVLFNVSLIEMIVSIFSVALLGLIFLYVYKKLSFIWINIALFIVIAGVTWLLHELAHYYFAMHYGSKTELRFWGIGTLALIVTSLLFGVVFGQPARTMINETDKLEKRKNGIISLAGPAISLIISIIFLLVIIYGGNRNYIGMIGFPISMVACVYSLLPFEPMEGKAVFTWNSWIWGIVFIPSLLLYLGMIILILP